MKLQNLNRLSNTSAEATLGNKNGYTIFSFDNRVIKFKAPYSLEYYDHVKEWDNGYLVVMEKYRHSKELIEEYIDLEPILTNLYMDTDTFLKAIRMVKIDNDRYHKSSRQC